ncbi:cellulase family glycosylhydrolase [Streptomyces sp. NPDC013157]|uniref:cellulase family glycosylhydrolase n=1 Tax=Streptomyces sp. NPDC013157 TaxID=3364861 RepID=UPI003680E92B
MPTAHDTVLARYKATWTQIAGMFRKEPGRLTFESINEPTFEGTDASLKARLLNEPNTSFHDIVRKSGGNNTVIENSVPKSVTPTETMIARLTWPPLSSSV